MDCHTFVAAHGNHIALQVSYLRRIAALINGEWTQAMLARISIGLCNDPSWGVANTKIQDLALDDQRVERLHQFRDLGGEIPAMDVVL